MQPGAPAQERAALAGGTAALLTDVQVAACLVLARARAAAGSLVGAPAELRGHAPMADEPLLTVVREAPGGAAGAVRPGFPAASGGLAAARDTRRPGNGRIRAAAGPGTSPRRAWRERSLRERGGLVREDHEDLLGRSVALYSADSRYRYLLIRRWSQGGPTCVCLLLNPSTATAFRNDPTVSRCIRLARGRGCAALVVVNLFAYRATDPRQLALVDDPVGPRNDEIILQHCRPGWLVIAGWGVRGQLRGRGAQVTGMLAAAGVELRCLDLTLAGQPHHPGRRVRLDQPLVPYPGRRAR